MLMLGAQVGGVVVFWIVTIAVGIRLRGHRELAAAESLSRVSHLAFWLGLVAPWALGFIWPRPAALDRLVGLPPLPVSPWVRLVLGIPLLVGGVVLMQLSISSLKRLGAGAPAFKLTGSVVDSGVYARVRNPMALGFYPACLGGALLSGSSWMLLYTVLGVIVAHAFNLRFFEELELSIRYGEAYERYREVTPFLLPRFGSGPKREG
jgi:protein-S-isoprenylcysteine O-methyltransferase Ste14